MLRRDGDTFILPEDQSTIPLLSPQEYEGTMPYTPGDCDPFRDQEGAFWSVLKGEESEEYVLCTYRRLIDDYYYLYYMPLTSVEAFYQTRFDVDSVLTGAEAVYGGYFVSWVEEEDGYRLFYGSSVFEGLDQPSDLGVSIVREKSGFRPATVGDARYMVAVSSPKWVSSVGANIRIAYFVPYENYYGATYGNHIILLVIALAFFIVLAVWVLAARRLMAGGIVTRTQRRHYGPRRLRIVAASLGVIGMVVILLTGMFSGALTDIYDSTTACQGALDTLSAMQAESSEHEARMTAQRSDQYHLHSNY